MDSTNTGGAQAATLMERVLYEVKRVVVGQDQFLERVMVAMLSNGHLLVEGVPGLAKTLTVKTLAQTLRGQFKATDAGAVQVSSALLAQAVDLHAGITLRLDDSALLSGTGSAATVLLQTEGDLFAGGSIEAGNAWASRRDISFKGLRTGTSLFIGADTGVGPLYLGVVSAPKGYTGLYLFLGRP